METPVLEHYCYVQLEFLSLNGVEPKVIRTNQNEAAEILTVDRALY